MSQNRRKEDDHNSKLDREKIEKMKQGILEEQAENQVRRNMKDLGAGRNEAKWEREKGSKSTDQKREIRKMKWIILQEQTRERSWKKELEECERTSQGEREKEGMKTKDGKQRN